MKMQVRHLSQQVLNTAKALSLCIAERAYQNPTFVDSVAVLALVAAAVGEPNEKHVRGSSSY